MTVVRFLLGLAIGISILVAPAYIAESAPVSVRGSMLVTFQIATTSGIALFANFIVGAVFLGALGALGGSVTFGIFLALALVSSAFVYVLAPAAKGRPLEAISTYWHNGGRWPEETRT